MRRRSKEIKADKEERQVETGRIKQGLKALWEEQGMQAAFTEYENKVQEGSKKPAWSELQSGKVLYYRMRINMKLGAH